MPDTSGVLSPSASAWSNVTSSASAPGLPRPWPKQNTSQASHAHLRDLGVAARFGSIRLSLGRLEHGAIWAGVSIHRM
jgi:hypothetical protein